jgi:anaerobic ribonucleoside-triphosphate reductase
MDESFTSDDSIDRESNDIRPADGSKRELLQQDTRTEYEKQIEEAINLSSMEYREKEITNERFEEEIIANYYKVSNERKEHFRNLLFDLGKLIRFDKETKEIYEIIEPIIDSYCNQFIDKCELDEITYDRIFNALKGIRTNKKNIEHLANLLIRKE